MKRITQKDLEALVNDINAAQGIDNAKYNEFNAYQLSYAYGGVQLHRIDNNSGGCITISKDGYDTKRKLYEFLRGFNLYQLKHNDEVIFNGTENECYFKLQREQGQSADWAMKYEGWTITKIY